ncbi:MAG: hypothetical protein HKM89_09615 [Gemmatimonadales bacterium]|nr:hypothetical protein [Gemmatimonadales bacterium]
MTSPSNIMDPEARHLTAQHDANVDRAVERVLRPIVAAVEQRMGRDLRSLALIGGFGRGEGGIRLADGDFHVVNDIDLLVVPRGLGFLGWRRHASALAAMAERLAEDLGIKQIDIGFRTVGMLQRPSITVADYEIAAGHIVLSGARLPVALGRFDDGRAIPRSEGTVYFLNRGSGLLIARRYLSRNGTVEERDAENFTIESDKALLAMGDAVLIERGLYCSSYLERAKRMEHVDLGALEDGDWIKAQYLESIRHKLFPDAHRVGKQDPMAWWETIQQTFLRFFVGYESRRLGLPITDWKAYAPLIGRRWTSGRALALARGLKHLLDHGTLRGALGPARWREAGLRQPRRLLQVMPLLLSAARPSGVRLDELGLAERLLGRTPKGTPHGRWTDAVNQYLLLYHPGGAAAEVAGRRSGKEPGRVRL